MISLRSFRILLVISLISNQFDFVYNYYCDHNLCSSSQEYCCGDNICCIYSNYYWTYYFWIFLIIIITITSLAWLLSHYFRSRKFSTQLYFLKVMRDIIKKIQSSVLSKKVSWLLFTCFTHSFWLYFFLLY